MSPDFPTYPDLAGKVVVVTGGSRGIGATTGRYFAASGSKVAIVGRDQSAIEAVVEDIKAAGGTAIGVAADCASESDLEALRQRVEAELGRAEVVAAFAGSGGNKSFEQMDLAYWQSALDNNLTATFLTIKAFLPGMQAAHSGSIITMSSTAGRQPSQASVAYAAAKAGIVMLTRHLATELGPQGIRVNCIAPGGILTERTKALIPEAQVQQVANFIPLRRWGVPEDIATSALFLASSSSSWMTGVTLDVSGGRVTG